MNWSPKNRLLTPNSFSFRLAIAITATMILVSVSLALFEVQQERDFFTERTLLLESERAQLIAQTFERDIEEVRRDILTLSRATAVDATAASVSGTSGNEALLRDPGFLSCGSQLTEIFKEFMGSHLELRQILSSGFPATGSAPDKPIRSCKSPIRSKPWPSLFEMRWRGSGQNRTRSSARIFRK